MFVGERGQEELMANGGSGRTVCKRRQCGYSTSGRETIGENKDESQRLLQVSGVSKLLTRRGSYVARVER